MFLSYRIWNPKEKKYSIDDSSLVKSYGKNANKYLELCTELKDKNGKLIFENDFVKIDSILFIVEWRKQYASFMLYNPFLKSSINFMGIKECDIEVVGNVCENPNFTYRR